MREPCWLTTAEAGEERRRGEGRRGGGRGEGRREEDNEVEFWEKRKFKHCESCGWGEVGDAGLRGVSEVCG